MVGGVAKEGRVGVVPRRAGNGTDSEKSIVMCDPENGSTQPTARPLEATAATKSARLGRVSRRAMAA